MDGGLECVETRQPTHCGETVKHRSRVARNPLQPNLRQVHLAQVELLEIRASSSMLFNRASHRLCWVAGRTGLSFERLA